MGIICIKDDAYENYCCIIRNKTFRHNELTNVNYNYLSDHFLSDDSDIESPKEIIFNKPFK